MAIAWENTLVVLADPGQVNALLHPNSLKHVLGADSRTLEDTRRTECTR